MNSKIVNNLAFKASVPMVIGITEGKRAIDNM